jgi:hypothetical protein
MSLLQNTMAKSGTVDFYNGVATQSVRLNKADSAYLTRTPSSTGNRKTWTWSGWLKRGTTATSGHNQTLFSAGTSVLFSGFWTAKLDAPVAIRDSLVFYEYIESTGTDYGKAYSLKLRDHSAWYHLMIAIDTTQATASNRLKVYVNGERITEISTDYGDLPEDYLTSTNKASHPNYVGRYADNSQFLDGYLSEVNFVDGLQLAPSNFGETKNGVWIPIEPNVSDYGTNGFRLKFNSSDFNEDGSAVTDPYGSGTDVPDDDVADASGSGNHFSVSGLVTSDFGMPDSPENNFATLNALDKGSQVDLAEGNLGVSWSGTTGHSVRSTFTMFSGKWYAEFMRGASEISIGIAKQNNTGVGVSWLGDTAYGAGGSYAYNSSGTKRTNGSNDSYGATFASGDIIGVAFDSDNGTITFYKNGASQGEAYSGISGEFSFGLGYYGAPINSTKAIINFGQDGSFAGTLTGTAIGDETDGNGYGLFKYAPPSGFLSLCSANLEELTIGANSDTQADDHFNSFLFTGNGGADRSLALNTFTPDWAWLKARSGADNHVLIDSSRRNGANYPNLHSNATDGEANDAFPKIITDGIITSEGLYNNNNVTFVVWNWKANGGTTSTIAVDSVSSGVPSIASAVQANTDAGFSIVTYSGNTDASATIGHGLGVVPKMIMVKKRDEAGNWIVFTETTGATNKLNLNATTAVAVSALFNDTAPTSTVFSVKDTSSDDTFGDGHTYVAYCFADVEGFSKFGSYTGNGVTSGDGTFAFLGFRPAFIMIKNKTASAEWVMVDSVRSTFNEVDDILVADDSSSEADFGTTNRNIDFLSNGFKIMNTVAGGTTALNTSGSIYTYMAFAEQPFKYANAR